jgi:hypothetical protein
VLSEEAVGALTDVASVRDVLLRSTWTVASGDDFLMSLCDLRIGVVPFAVEEDLVVVRSDS